MWHVHGSAFLLVKLTFALSMENKEIAGVFKKVGQLMELHGENKFKARSYSNASFQIGKYAKPIREMPVEEYESIPGIGKNLVPKLQELIETGSMSYLQRWIDQTPAGVIEILAVKGLGPSKVRLIWQEMGIESLGELLYACNENRLVDLKGFGAKTQQQVKESIEFLLSNKDSFLYASVEPLVVDIEQWFQQNRPEDRIGVTGAFLRRDPVLDNLEFVVAGEGELPDTSESSIPIEFYSVKVDAFDEEVYFRSTDGEAEDLRGVVPEMRNAAWGKSWSKQHSSNELIEVEDLVGCLHNHSTYSDGIHPLKDMSEHLASIGMQYFGISDHSKTAVYAGGLTEAEIEQQHAEVDALNASLQPFRVLKGIESDILSDGSLDYSDEVLKTFDFVVASVHSAMKMDEATATARLIKAVEHPATKILGHPTGRLLLSRPGYPIDHQKVIDACAANGVAVELNANPLRLDIDYAWIPYCMEKNVMVSINPDAHRIEGFDHMRYGVYAARKGGLVKEMCLNALPLEALLSFFDKEPRE